MYSNAPFMISVQSSGSSWPAASVEFLTSQNRMETTRRSPTISPLARAATSLSRNSLGTYFCRSCEGLVINGGTAAGEGWNSGVRGLGATAGRDDGGTGGWLASSRLTSVRPAASHPNDAWGARGSP